MKNAKIFEIAMESEVKKYDDFFRSMYNVKRDFILKKNNGYPVHRRTYSKGGDVKVYVLFLRKPQEEWKPIAYDYNMMAIDDLYNFLVYLLREVVKEEYEVQLRCMKESKFETGWLNSHKNGENENCKRENEIVSSN